MWVRILAVDPGADTGWALFDPEAEAFVVPKGLATAPSAPKRGHGALVACGVRARSKPLPRPTASQDEAIVEVFGERPKIYPHSKIPTSDIITLAIRAGAAIGPYQYPADPAVPAAKVTYYEPWEWKGSVAKNVHHQRLWGHLGPHEKELVAKTAEGMAPSKRHNMMDAIGIGLFALGRTRCGGT